MLTVVRYLDIIPLQGWKLNDKLFIDDINSEGWKVYEKENEYKVAKTFKPVNYKSTDGKLGGAFAINQNKSLGVFGHPDESRGTVVVYIPDAQGQLGESARVNPNC